MDTKVVEKLIQEAIETHEELFLVNYHISTSGSIEVIIDGDHGVQLDECIRVSRHIEHNLDREEHDFSLLVTTPDITKPIVLPRQYNKNIGRVMQIETKDQKFEGTLLAIKDDVLTLEFKTRVPKAVGKGKQTVIKQEMIPIDQIIKSKVKIVFN